MAAHFFSLMSFIILFSLFLQLECCGVLNYTDWSSRPWFSSHNNSVPHSCCKANTTCTGQFNHPEVLNTHVRRTPQKALFYTLNYYDLNNYGVFMFW